MRCLIIACTLLVSAATGVLATPINNERGIFCPHFPGCGTEVERRALLSKRQIECPPGVHCDTEPVCTIHNCDLCPDFPGCGAEIELHALRSKRHSECTPGSLCGHGPVCSIHDCDLCPDFPGCDVERRALSLAKHRLEKEKRNAQDDLWCFVSPNDQDVCMIPYATKKEKRAAETGFILPCPFICNQQGKCVCTGENITNTTETEKRAAETDFIHPCPYICDRDGVCVCTAEKAKRTTEIDSFLPYPFDCNEHGTCKCHEFDGNRKCCVARKNDTNDCIITQRDAGFVQKRDTAFIRPCPLVCDKNGHCACASVDKTMKHDTAFIHPCPLICDGNGHCACAEESPSVNMTVKRDTDYRGPPCPSGNLICMKSGCRCGEPFIIPINGPPTTEKRGEDFRGPPCPTGSLFCNTSGCKCTGPPHVPINGPPTET